MLCGDGIHDNALDLQALLDQRGIVTIDRPGTYLVSRTLHRLFRGGYPLYGRRRAKS